MDKEKTELIKDLRKFIKKVRKNIKVSKFILFGSRARGNYRKDSDVDLLVISKDFKNKKFFKRSPPLYLSWDYPYEVDIICLTPTELEKKKREIGAIKQALQEGIELT